MKHAGWIFFWLMSLAGTASAQNSITALDVGAGGGSLTVRVDFAQPLSGLPGGFTTDTPPRIVLDFLDTANGLGESTRNFAQGSLRSANIVQVTGRTRLVINLERMLAYNTSIDGNSLLIALQGDVAEAGGEIAAAPVEEADSSAELRFDIAGYTLEGATLLPQDEIDAAVAPFTGKNKDFSDVQRALEAIEEAYAVRGYSAVRVMLPEQELEQGTVRFQVVESRLGKVTVKDNNFVSEANALHALPSVRSGNPPRTRQIARELRFANENPARQLNVVLKAGEEEGLVDADVIVTDSEPTAWGLSADNTGTDETGRERLGLSWRHANLFDADHVASLQFQTSPAHTDRVAVVSGGYKIPFYGLGGSLELTAGYSNVNSILGGLDVVKGGGTMLGARYNHSLAKVGSFEPRLSFGLDWRKFSNISFNNVVVSPEIVVMPLNIAYSAQGKQDRSDIGFSASLSANLPGMDKGTKADFAAYNPRANPHYTVARYGASYARLVGDDWQVRVALNGQYSSDTLISGEQMRLGGADAVRGFSEGSAGGDSGMRWNLEAYTPNLGSGDVMARGLVFFDTGAARFADGTKSSISSSGIGLRASFAEQFSLRLDAARIINADTDPLTCTIDCTGDWRVHVGLSVSF